jgi:putative resolvase
MENTISTGKAAALLGISVKTLQRWEREGRLVPIARTDTNRRVYTESQIKTFLGVRTIEKPPHRIVAYCRVSSAAQKTD